MSVVFLTASAPVALVAACGNPPPPVRVFHADRLGSTQVVTDYNGAIYIQARYYAYGEICGRFNAAGNPTAYAQDARFEFTGYETDFAGLDYAGARFFDPELAQFGSQDPAGQYPSPYAYGPGDPINGNDPGGAIFGIDDAIIIAIALEVAYDAAVTAAIAATVAFVDTYRQTGSARAGVRAMGESIANSASMGGYGLVQAISNDEAGHYLANYAANMATSGIYGTVRAFHDGQYGAGILGVIQIAALAYGAYSAYQANSGTASGTASTPERAAAAKSGGEGATVASEPSLPQGAIVRPGETVTIADPSYGSRANVEVGTPIEIPADPAPELSFDYRISFERQVLDQPGRTIHGFKSELMSESLPTTPRRIYRFSSGKGWTRPTVEFTNTGNVPLAVRVRSVVEVGT